MTNACPTRKEPAYPIFFPIHHPTETGYTTRWYWFDPNLSPEDVGSFDTRGDAVADWAVTHFEDSLAAELAAMDVVLGSPMLAAPSSTPAREPDPGYLLAQLDAIDVATYEPKTESGRALLALNLAERVLQQRIVDGFNAVAVLNQASAENRGLLGDLLTGERRLGGLVLGPLPSLAETAEQVGACQQMAEQLDSLTIFGGTR
jgi:hypothetical protein